MMIATAMRRLVHALAGHAAAPPANRPSPRAESTEVDVELVLAVDISYSMDMEEQRLQREGYIQALTSPEVLQAIRAGMNGRIAVIVFRVGWSQHATHRGSLADHRRAGNS